MLARRCLLGVAALSLVALSDTASLASDTSRSAVGPPCTYPSGVTAGRWVQLPGPPDVALTSVGQLDGSPCSLIGTDARRQVWRSDNAGLSWRQVSRSTTLDRVVTERLAVLRGGSVTGPVLGVGPDPALPSQTVPRVVVSGDDGTTFQAAAPVAGATVAGSNYGFGPSTYGKDVAQTVPAPLNADVLTAASAMHYQAGTGYVYVYAAARIPAAGTTVTKSSPSVLLRSTDGGATFERRPSIAVETVLTPLQVPTITAGAGEIALNPTTVAVNSSVPDEVWINDNQPGGSGGGAWKSVDGGQSFTQVCCPDITVEDIAITSFPVGGSAVVLLATDHGLLRSADDGETWSTLDGTPITGVRTAPDAPGTILVQTATSVELFTARAARLAPLPGLPPGCHPQGLRRDGVTPPTFLVDCADRSTYRLLLTDYPAGGDGLSHEQRPGSGGQGPASSGGLLVPRALPQLATFSLPGSRTKSGAIAFSGTAIFYDMKTAGDIGMISATTGRYLGVIRTGLRIVALTFDLKRTQLLIATSFGDLDAYDPVTRRLTRLSLVPYRVPSFDASIDGFSWVPEGYNTLYRGSRVGGPAGAHRACDVTYPSTGVRAYPAGTSTYVAAGDGGGYVQDEDDATIYRIDARCAVTGVYRHRVFSESGDENDALACDAQSYFPQAAIWIRDSNPGTVTAYGVPFGYCPMPSAMTLSAPAIVSAGSMTRVCTRLTNATTGLPATNRPVVISAAHVLLGHGQTDSTGVVCMPYTAPPALTGGLPVPLSASFAGDSALYPSTAAGLLTVVGTQPIVPPTHQGSPLLGPAPPLAVPPNPVTNPVNVPVPGAVQAPNPVQAPQGQLQAQAQPQAQGVVVPQRQTQPQLVFARAVTTLQNQVGTQDYAMSAQRARQPADGSQLPGLLGGGAAALGCAVGLRLVLAGGRRARAIARANQSPASTRRSRRRDRSIRRSRRPRRVPS